MSSLVVPNVGHDIEPSCEALVVPRASSIQTKQETFNAVATHLLKQGRRSIAGTTCRYRSANGDKCAVGCLIPDEEYSPYIEGQNVFSLIREGDVPSIKNLDSWLLRDLQLLHDEREPETWQIALIQIAAKHELSARVIQGVER